MEYDFDRVIERRGTSSVKWDLNDVLFERDDVLDMWVADMDFPSPEPVLAAIRERAAHPIFGYTFPHAGLYEAIIDWNRRRYGWEVEREWIVCTAGVVNGLYNAIRSVTRPGDEVIIQSPVYYPFAAAVKNCGCQVVHNRLVLRDGRYTMDFDALRDSFATRTTFPAHRPRIKALILCSPHNPVGRSWTAEELRTLADICLENDCVLISDEIHCDLLVKDVTHTATATISPAAAANTITLHSASKTFNLAGLGTSYVIIPDARRRRAVREGRTGGGNLFGYVAMEAAFRHGEEYLAQLLTYLRGNLDLFREGLRRHQGRLQLIEPEGTYLAWVDMRGLGLDQDELTSFIRNQARLALDDGYAFGPGGEGFQRFNLACPRSIVREALRRLDGALAELPG